MRLRKIRNAVLLASVTAATSLLSFGAGAQSPNIMYHRTFYSDATLTVQVGWYRDKCWNGRVVASPVQGVTSPYYTLEAIGSCGGYW
ncbi:hypothetical protein [Brevundimonas sp. ZS04]|uniref:hypothetical protein n=1 Tax=Brevundimonas sp. ZS04 TaxID=1906854 RepID=UPI00096F3D3D|nr:hypothetical protein [Brevundimonas sp. ZS04]OMG58381.1 hypothetical protein BJP32_09565 [Brevundimonas sp. ZS04]